MKTRSIDLSQRVTRELYFTTDTVVNWIDVFTRPSYKHIIVESLAYCQREKGLVVYAWVLLKQIQEDIQESRSKWMLNLFEFAGKQDHKIKNYKLWQDGNDAQLIYSNDYLMQKLNYIHCNPVVAEYVNNPEDYRYGSAIDYAGGKGLLDVILVE